MGVVVDDGGGSSKLLFQRPFTTTRKEKGTRIALGIKCFQYKNSVDST